MPPTTFHVVYLTGAPATGKSTLLAKLEQEINPVRTFCYSKELSQYIGLKYGHDLSQEGIREQSAKIVTHEDVKAVDEQLIEMVSACRDTSHIVIDSHPVTKEAFGFRVTPFSLELLSRVSPTLIFNLYADPEVVLDRIRANSQGRPMVTAYEAGYHNGLQGCVAITYGIHRGIPIYMLDSSVSTEELADQVCRRLK